MNAALDPAVSCFSARQQENAIEAELWRGKLQAFRNLYNFLSQIIPCQDTDLEKLYVFLRHLGSKLPRRKGGPSYQFDDDVRLEYYRLQRSAKGRSVCEKVRQVHCTDHQKWAVGWFVKSALHRLS
jgi:type I restriction enzyme, R subunit